MHAGDSKEMGILAKLLGFVPRKELKGLCLGNDAYWKIAPTKDLPSLLRALPKVVPEDAILYLEGGTPPQEIRVFLDTNSVPEVTHLAMGTIWPRPRTFHLPATQKNLSRLAELAEKCAACEVAIHLHVYKHDQVLLEWYDAFFDDPMHLSREIPQEKIHAFCTELSLPYEVCKDRLAQNPDKNN
jgi:hypothetical protein